MNRPPSSQAPIQAPLPPPTDVSYESYSPSPSSIDAFEQRNHRIDAWTRAIGPGHPSQSPGGRSVGAHTAKWSTVALPAVPNDGRSTTPAGAGVARRVSTNNIALSGSEQQHRGPRRRSGSASGLLDGAAGSRPPMMPPPKRPLPAQPPQPHAAAVAAAAAASPVDVAAPAPHASSSSHHQLRHAPSPAPAAPSRRRQQQQQQTLSPPPPQTQPPPTPIQTPAAAPPAAPLSVSAPPPQSFRPVRQPPPNPYLAATPADHVLFGSGPPSSEGHGQLLDDLPRTDSLLMRSGSLSGAPPPANSVRAQREAYLQSALDFPLDMLAVVDGGGGGGTPGSGGGSGGMGGGGGGVPSRTPSPSRGPGRVGAFLNRARSNVSLKGVGSSSSAVMGGHSSHGHIPDVHLVYRPKDVPPPQNRGRSASLTQRPLNVVRPAVVLTRSATTTTHRREDSGASLQQQQKQQQTHPHTPHRQPIVAPAPAAAWQPRVKGSATTRGAEDATLLNPNNEASSRPGLASATGQGPRDVANHHHHHHHHHHHQLETASSTSSPSAPVVVVVANAQQQEGGRLLPRGSHTPRDRSVVATNPGTPAAVSPEADLTTKLHHRVLSPPPPSAFTPVNFEAPAKPTSSPAAAATAAPDTGGATPGATDPIRSMRRTSSRGALSGSAQLPHLPPEAAFASTREAEGASLTPSDSGSSLQEPVDGFPFPSQSHHHHHPVVAVAAPLANGNDTKMYPRVHTPLTLRSPHSPVGGEPPLSPRSWERAARANVLFGGAPQSGGGSELHGPVANGDNPPRSQSQNNIYGLTKDSRPGSKAAVHPASKSAELLTQQHEIGLDPVNTLHQLPQGSKLHLSVTLELGANGMVSATAAPPEASIMPINDNPAPLGSLPRSMGNIIPHHRSTFSSSIPMDTSYRTNDPRPVELPPPRYVHQPVVGPGEETGAMLDDEPDVPLPQTHMSPPPMRPHYAGPELGVMGGPGPVLARVPTGPAVRYQHTGQLPPAPGIPGYGPPPMGMPYPGGMPGPMGHPPPATWGQYNSPQQQQQHQQSQYAPQPQQQYPQQHQHQHPQQFQQTYQQQHPHQQHAGPRSASTASPLPTATQRPQHPAAAPPAIPPEHPGGSKWTKKMWPFSQHKSTPTLADPSDHHQHHPVTPQTSTGSHFWLLNPAPSPPANGSSPHQPQSAGIVHNLFSFNKKPTQPPPVIATAPLRNPSSRRVEKENERVRQHGASDPTRTSSTLPDRNADKKRTSSRPDGRRKPVLGNGTANAKSLTKDKISTTSSSGSKANSSGAAAAAAAAVSKSSSKSPSRPKDAGTTSSKTKSTLREKEKKKEKEKSVKTKSNGVSSKSK